MSSSHVSDESEQTSNLVLSMLCSELISPKFSILKGYDCGRKAYDVVGKMSSPPNLGID